MGQFWKLLERYLRVLYLDWKSHATKKEGKKLRGISST